MKPARTLRAGKSHANEQSRRLVRMDVSVQAQRPIESAAERKGASVGPEGRTER